MNTIFIRKLPHMVGNLSGWRRNLTAFLCGVCLTLTLAPIFVFPLLIPSFTGLYWLINAPVSTRRRFWDGWWWGWGFYMTGLYWFCVALLTDDSFIWLIPFALFVLTGLFAIYAGIASALMTWIPCKGNTRLLAFSVVWMLVEYVRGHLFTGFPWNLPGYSFGFSTASLQIASLIGIYGLSGFAVLLGVSFAAFGQKKGVRLIVLVWGVFILAMIWGIDRQRQDDAIPENERYVDGVLLRLVQANISQPHKWDPKLQLQGVKDNIKLTQSPGLERVTHVIWPETAVPYVIDSEKTLAHLLGRMLPDNAILITGALRTEGNPAHFKIWNNLTALNHNGTVVGSYDKIHLVPFGEFQPIRPFVPKDWMTPVGDTDFSSGEDSHTVVLPGLPPMIPLICYEAIFPEMSFSADARPGMLLTLTNDAWFGTSTGPYQHFNMARMRAVEQGIPVIRVGNTGISAIIDAYGKVLSYLPLGTEGIIDAQLPKTFPSRTVYGTYGDFIIWGGCILMLLIIMLQKRIEKKFS